MIIHHRPASVIYKLVIGTLSLITEWFILIGNGPAALRLFPTWVLFLSATYYLASAVFLALNHERDAGKPPCPVFEGMIIVGFFLMSAMAILSARFHFYLPPLSGWIVWMVCLILPLLALFDWILFDAKGRWHPMAPFYWLALPVCYAATTIFTADLLPFGSQMVYPLEILNYASSGFFNLLEWIFAVVVCVLIAGYILYLLDYISSGKLAKAIVLPHLQAIEVDEEIPAKAPPVVFRPILPASADEDEVKTKTSSAPKPTPTPTTSPTPKPVTPKPKLSNSPTAKPVVKKVTIDSISRPSTNRNQKTSSTKPKTTSSDNLQQIRIKVNGTRGATSSATLHRRKKRRR